VTFAIFTQPNGLKRLVTPDYVVAVQSTAGDAVSRVWTIADSAPGASRSYSIVNGTFAATVAAIGGLVTLPLPDGEQVALAPRWVTQLEALPGNTATRVTWAADAAGGYATVVGTQAATAAALAYTPPAASWQLDAPCNTSHANASNTDAGAFYVPAAFTGSGEILLTSTGGTNGRVQILSLAGVVQAQANDPGPTAGYRARAFGAVTLAPGWYVLGLAEIGGGGGSVTLLGVRLS